jgi:hypothetical protein
VLMEMIPPLIKQLRLVHPHHLHLLALDLEAKQSTKEDEAPARVTRSRASRLLCGFIWYAVIGSRLCVRYIVVTYVLSAGSASRSNDV